MNFIEFSEPLKTPKFAWLPEVLSFCQQMHYQGSNTQHSSTIASA